MQTGFKGVYRSVGVSKQFWRTERGGRINHLGRFATAEEAASRRRPLPRARCVGRRGDSRRTRAADGGGGARGGGGGGLTLLRAET